MSVLLRGGTIIGQTLPLSSSPIRFCPRVWHAIEDYPIDQSRLVLVAYSSQGLSKLAGQNPQSYESLRQLGFPVPSFDSASLAMLHVASEPASGELGEPVPVEPSLCCCDVPAFHAAVGCPQQGESLTSLKIEGSAKAGKVEVSKAGKRTHEDQTGSKEDEINNTVTNDFSEGVGDRNALVKLCAIALESDSNPGDVSSRASCMPACVEVWRDSLSSSSENSWCEVSS